MYGLGLVGYQLRDCSLREQVLVLVQHEGLYIICVLDICCLMPDTGTDVRPKKLRHCCLQYSTYQVFAQEQKKFM